MSYSKNRRAVFWWLLWFVNCSNHANCCVKTLIGDATGDLDYNGSCYSCKLSSLNDALGVFIIHNDPENAERFRQHLLTKWEYYTYRFSTRRLRVVICGIHLDVSEEVTCNLKARTLTQSTQLEWPGGSVESFSRCQRYSAEKMASTTLS